MSDIDDDRRNQRVALIEDRLDVESAGAVQISRQAGGIEFTSMSEVMEFSKLMACSQQAVPSFLRGNPGACLAITLQAIEWKMSPFAVANKAYVARDGQPIAYESQLVHAVIEARAPIQGRLRCRYEGDGMDRRCIVFATFKGEDEPHEFRSEPLGKLLPPMGQNGRKGSPLWDKKPDLQLFYNASRDWARQYCPDVLLGIYTPDDLEETPIGQIEPKDVSPNLLERLPGRIAGDGFAIDAVENAVRDLQGGDQPKARRKPGQKLKTSPAPAIEHGEASQSEIHSPHGHEPPRHAGEPSPASSSEAARADLAGEDAIDEIQDLAATEIPSVETVNPGTAPANREPATREATRNDVREEPLPAGQTQDGQAGEKPAQHARMPQNMVEYRKYLSEWLNVSTTPSKIHTRFDGENDMRKRLQQGPKERRVFEAMRDDRLSQLAHEATRRLNEEQ